MRTDFLRRLKQKSMHWCWKCWKTFIRGWW